MTDDKRTNEAIALALSGGGSRAIAFHLGCLRALQAQGILENIRTISSVSGGSVLGALYCSYPGTFEQFDGHVRGILASGFVKPSARVALTSFEGLKAILFSSAVLVDRSAAMAMRLILRFFPARFRVNWSWLTQSGVRRTYSRSTILLRVFDEILQGASFNDLRDDKPKLIIIACDLGAKSAFYFAKDGVGSWRRGMAPSASLKLAEAVAASAAYPVFLPAIERSFAFTKHGKDVPARVTLTDGGVYDNLGLAPLWPDRDPNISLHVEQYDRLIVSRAGYGLKLTPAPTFWPSRMFSVFESIHARAQNAAVQRLHDITKAQLIKGFILPYISLDDSTMLDPPHDLVTAEQVDNYPTDFSAMPAKLIEALSKRGEQVTVSLIKQHWDL